MKHRKQWYGFGPINGLRGDQWRFLEADFWPVSLRVCPGNNFRSARHLLTIGFSVLLAVEHAVERLPRRH